MTSTPSVCRTDIEQCLNRPLMTIAAHLLNITISSSSDRTQEFKMGTKKKVQEVVQDKNWRVILN